MTDTSDRIHFIKRWNLWLPVYDFEQSFNYSVNHKHLFFACATWDKEIKRLRELETIFTHAGMLKVYNYENYWIAHKKTFLWAKSKGIESASNLCFSYALCFTLFNECHVHIIIIIGNIFWQDFNCINIIIHIQFMQNTSHGKLWLFACCAIKHAESWNKKQGKIKQRKRKGDRIWHSYNPIVIFCWCRRDQD